MKCIVEPNHKCQHLCMELLQHSIDAIIVIDNQGVVTLFNRSAEKMFGFGWSDVIGQKLDVILPEQVKLAHAGYIEEFFRGKGRGVVGRTVELIANKKDGSEFPIELTLSLIKTEIGQYLMAVIRNIAEKKKDQVQLERYNSKLLEMVEERSEENRRLHEKMLLHEKMAAIGQAMSVISHDIRGPLSVISNILYLFNEMVELDSTGRQYVSDIKTQLHKCMCMLEGMNDFIRDRNPTMRKVGVYSVVNKALSNFNPDESKFIRNETENQMVLADDFQLERIFWNLIKNSLDAISGVIQPELLIKSRRQDSWVLVELIDNGLGIKSEDLKKLFTPLFTTKRKGIGLGLVSCQNLIKKCGGKIEIESVYGQGTTVRVWLVSWGGRVDEENSSG